MPGTPSKNSTIDLLHYLNEAVLRVGPLKLIKFLKNLAHKEESLEDSAEYRKLATGIGVTTANDIQDIVIKCTCLKYDVSVHEFMNRKRLQGTLFEVACVVTALLQSHAMLSQTEIAERIGRHKTNVNKYHQRYLMNSGKTKEERRMLIYVKEISENIDKIVNPELQENG